MFDKPGVSGGNPYSSINRSIRKSFPSQILCSSSNHGDCLKVVHECGLGGPAPYTNNKRASPAVRGAKIENSLSDSNVYSFNLG